MIGEVNREPVEVVCDRGASHTSGCVVGPEHEVVDEELRASSEEVCQRGAAFLRVESIRLVNPDPRQLLASSCQFVATPRQLLLLLQQPEPGRKPFLLRYYVVFSFLILWFRLHCICTHN